MCLSLGKEITLESDGTSMIPLICAGDSVVITPISISDVQVGDVVVFKSRDQFIVHRVVGRQGVSFLEKGDNAFACRELAPGTVLGKVIRVQRGDRSWGLDTVAWRAVNRAVAAYGIATWRFYTVARRATKGLLCTGGAHFIKRASAHMRAISVSLLQCCLWAVCSVIPAIPDKEVGYHGNNTGRQATVGAASDRGVR
jgi:hypothetical protein